MLPTRLSLGLFEKWPLLAFALSMQVSTWTWAQLPTPYLWSVSPPGEQRGAAFELAINGADLEGLEGLRFSHPEIRATPKLKEDTDEPEPNRFVVYIPPEIRLGIYEVRAVGTFGVSNPRAFAVGDLFEVRASGANHTAVTAQRIPLETTVSGTVTADREDYFVIAARAGQRLLIECLASEIDSRLNPVLELRDQNGRILRRDTRQQLIDYRVPEDGDLMVAIHDSIYRGGNEFFYRLSIHTGAHLDFVFPPAVETTKQREVRLFGRNLQPSESNSGASGIQSVATSLRPAGAALGRLKPYGRPSALGLDQDFFEISSPIGSGTSLALGVANLPVVEEVGDNDRADRAQIVSAPCEIAGRFYPARDRDWFEFEATEGDVFWIEAVSHRLDLPTSPFLLLQKVVRTSATEVSVKDVKELYASDKNIGGREFNTASYDPAWRFKVPETATYRLMIRDLFNQSANDPQRLYRLVIRKPVPDFDLAAMAVVQNGDKNSKAVRVGATSLRGGEVLPVRVIARRQDGFNDPIELRVDGLPPGIRCDPTTLPAGANQAMLFLHALKRADAWVGSLKIIGTATIGNVAAVRKAEFASVVWNVGNYDNEVVASRMTAESLFALNPHELIPLTFSTGGTNSWKSARGLEVKIPFEVIRRGEFNEKLQLKLNGLKALEKLPEVAVEGKGTNGVFNVDLAKYKVPAGRHTLYLQTHTKGKYKRHPESKDAKDVTAAFYSAPFYLEVAPAPFSLELDSERIRAQAGKRLEVPFELKRFLGYDKEVNVSVTLPKSVPGISASESKIEGGNSTGTLSLSVDETVTATKVTLNLKATAKAGDQDLSAERKLELEIVSNNNDQ